jgi:hypothetical protein
VDKSLEGALSALEESRPKEAAVPYSKSRLAEYLTTILANTTSDPEGVDINSCIVLGGAGTRIAFSNENGGQFVGQLPNEGAPTLFIAPLGTEAFAAFIDECQKDDEIARLVGPKAVGERLQDVIREEFTKSGSERDIEVIVRQQVLKHLRAEIQEWLVKVPIANLKLTCPLQIGNVTFQPLDEGVVSNVAAVLKKGPGSGSALAVSNSARLLQIVDTIASSASAWAVVSLRCHARKIMDVARQEAERAICVVRAFTHAFYGFNLRALFGMPHELAGGVTGVIAERDAGLHIPMEQRGWLASFEVNDAMIKRLREEFCFDRLCKIAAKSWDESSSLERTVRVAFLWLGRAVIARTLAESFTQCTIAIERLLIVDDEGTTTDRFAGRLAHLLSDDVEQRIAIHRRAKVLYDIRSRIVHAGFESVEPEELQEIESMAMSALIKVSELLEKISDHVSLRDLLHERTMGRRDAPIDHHANGAPHD